jgi:hypothetical protein
MQSMVQEIQSVSMLTEYLRYEQPNANTNAAGVTVAAYLGRHKDARELIRAY